LEKIDKYEQCHVYNDSHIDVCFETEKGEMTMEQSITHAARTTLKLKKMK